MKTMPWLAAMLALSLAAPDAGAALFKCVGKDGAVSYQADPCPVAADEKKMKEPAAGPVPGAAPGKSSSDLKEGWTAAEIDGMAERCIPGVIGPARSNFAATARKAGDAASKFPEAELTPHVRAMCTCFAKRVGNTYTQAEFQKDRAEILAKMNDDAMKGGPCQPTGPLEEAMRGTR